jgi:transposase
MLARRQKSTQAFAMRARIVLACAEGLSNVAAAKKLHITGATVCKWRERFRVSRLEGLLDEPLETAQAEADLSRMKLMVHRLAHGKSSPTQWFSGPLAHQQ